MTYCVGLKLDRGLLMAADTRTNAGFDNIASFRKLHTWQKPGERAFVLLSAGNLAVSQAVVSNLTEQVQARRRRPGGDSLFTAATMFQAARAVGRTLKEVRRAHAEHTEDFDHRESFSASFILGGQIGQEEPRLFQIYPEGNCIETGIDTPFFQIGEHKYGKPILDRVADRGMALGEAAKVVLLSFDSTLRSNLSVGMPIDMVAYARDSLCIDRVRRIENNDPYFTKLSADWSGALRAAVANIDPFDI